MHKHKKYTLLKGEGIHQHTLYGSFASVDSAIYDFDWIEVLKDSVLRHEKPDATFGEHKALPIKRAVYVMGKQVEYNPFSRMLSRVWD